MPTEGTHKGALVPPRAVVEIARAVTRPADTSSVSNDMLDVLVMQLGVLRADLWRRDADVLDHLGSGSSTGKGVPTVPQKALGPVIEQAANSETLHAQMLMSTGDAEEVRHVTVHGFHAAGPTTWVVLLHNELSQDAMALIDLFVHRVNSVIASRAIEQAERRGAARGREEAEQQQMTEAMRPAAISDTESVAQRASAAERSTDEPDTASMVPSLGGGGLSYIPPELAKQLASPSSSEELFERLARGLIDHVDVVRAAIYDRSCHRMAEAGDETDNYARERGLVIDARDNVIEYTREAPRQDIAAAVFEMVGHDGRLGSVVVEWDGLTGPPDDELAASIIDYAASVVDGIDAYHSMEKSFDHTVLALAQMLDASDQYTGDHARHVAEWAVEVGCRLGLDGTTLKNIEVGALLHDIGKVAMPRSILNKAGRLTEAEYEVMKTHTIVGERIIAPIEFLDQVRPIVRHEHERWDGHGYPDGLSGDEIPIGSRIILVCDTFHAITSERPYRSARDEETACAILRENAGSQFDPAVVQTFLDVLGDSEVKDRIERQVLRAMPDEDDVLRDRLNALEVERLAESSRVAEHLDERDYEEGGARADDDDESAAA